MLGKGLCSHTSSLSYTGFSTMSSQQEPSKLWGLPLGVPAQTPCGYLHASVGLCDGSSQFLDEPGVVLGPCCPSAFSAQLYLCIPGAHTETETTTSTSHGTQRKGFQHCFQPHGGLDSYRDPLSSVFCGPTVLLNSDLQHLPALGFILQLLHLHQESHPAVPGQPLLQPGHHLSGV